MGHSLGEAEKDNSSYWRNYALVVVSALLIAFSFPPFRLGFMAYSGLEERART